MLTEKVSRDWFSLVEENRLVPTLARLHDNDFGCALLPPEVALKYHSVYKTSSFGFPASADSSAQQLLLCGRATSIYSSVLRQKFSREQVTATINNTGGDQREHLGASPQVSKRMFANRAEALTFGSWRLAKVYSIVRQVQ